MLFFRPKIEWKSYRSEMEQLELIRNNIVSLNPVEINQELIKQVYTSGSKVADFKRPILATSGLYSCTGILAYDLSKGYAFLGHSFGNEAYDCLMPLQVYDGNHHKTPRGMPEASVHVIEMLDTLSKKELYQLKFAIIIGSKPNVPLVEAMINTILNLKRKNFLVESIELRKPFIEEIHSENDINLGKEYSWEWHRQNLDKEVVKNNITKDYHAYSKTRGASFAFDTRDGKMYTYNSDTCQYYTYDDSPSVLIKIKEK